MSWSTSKNRNFSGLDGSKEETCLTGLSHSESKDINNYINTGRLSLRLDCHQKYMMAFAWVSPSERERFNLFPEIITVDTVFGTNNENRPLLTMGGKDSNGKMFIFLRAYLPHEKGWIFRWLFSIVLPKMFSKPILSRCRIVISDGDLQEYSQIDNAISKYFPQLIRVRCGWHIIDRAWEKYFSSKKDFPSESQLHYDEITTNVQHWLYSWMKPNCETFKEYVLSKYLLYKYLQSDAVINKVSTLMYSHVTLFVKKRIEIHESKFLFSLRKHVRHYAEYSNTVLEGCNNGIKYHSSNVTPQTRLDNSFTIISNNSDMKVVNLDKDVQNQYHTKSTRRNALEEQKICETHLTRIGFEILLSSFQNSKSYHSHKMNDSTWLVTKKELTTCSKSVTPKFKHVRTVTLFNGVLTCDCPHRSVYGMPCCHEIHVAGMFNGWKFPSHHDCSVTWWKAYYFFGMSSLSHHIKDRSTVFKIFHKLREFESPGTQVHQYHCNTRHTHGSIIPETFICNNQNPVALNYNHFSYDDMICETGHDNETIQGTTQLSQISQEPKESDFDNFDIDSNQINTLGSIDSILDDHNNDTDTSHMKPYSQLITEFKTLTSLMDGNCTKEDISEIHSFFQSQTEKITKRIREQLPDSAFPEGSNFVSSNVPASKRNKHHGCRGYNYN